MTFHSLRFDRAAATYESHARVQADMAKALIALLPHGGEGFRNGPILEMGCGTGLLTRRIRERFPDAELIATDAAPRMLETARANFTHNTQDTQYRQEPAGLPVPDAVIRWAHLDASGEVPPPLDVAGAAPFRLAASSALVQWFPRLDLHFMMVASLLAQGGCYLVSGFTRDNFPELNAILAGPPFGYPDYPGHDATGITAAAASAGLTVTEYREDFLETVPPTPQAFLDSIRGLGSARRPETGKPLTRERLRFLLSTYQERYACPGGVKATWKLWYALLRKPR